MILDLFRTEDRMAVVTGAGRGIGRAIALYVCAAAPGIRSSLDLPLVSGRFATDAHGKNA